MMPMFGFDPTLVPRGPGGPPHPHHTLRGEILGRPPPLPGRRDSLASIAVAAHEVGHVLQHAQGYAGLAIRSAIAPVASIGSMAAFPLFFIGLLFNLPGLSGTLMNLGILLFSGAVVFHLVTLPVEFDASKRALAQLTTSGAIAPQEVAGAKKVLDAAALTYVAAAAMAALQLVRLIMIRNSRD